MKRLVRLDTCAPEWPWSRQTPGRSGVWGGFKFEIDNANERCEAWAVFESIAATGQALCSPDRTVFITGEPSDIGQYHPRFLAQFHYVISGRSDLVHPRQIKLQPSHPWFVERDLDELLNYPVPTKSRDICILISDKAFTEGQRRRLSFLELLKREFPDIDVFGRGIQPFDNKWNTLLPYRYTIILENSDELDFVTEKMPDAWLAFCYPIYAGSVNAERYAPSEAFLRIDISKPDIAINSIRSLLSEKSSYDNLLTSVLVARKDYLMRWQFFANLAGVLEVIIGLSRTATQWVTIRPNHEFFAEDDIACQTRISCVDAAPSAVRQTAQTSAGLSSSFCGFLSSIAGRKR